MSEKDLIKMDKIMLGMLKLHKQKFLYLSQYPLTEGYLVNLIKRRQFINSNPRVSVDYIYMDSIFRQQRVLLLYLYTSH